jgi:hypothetical protein
MAEAAEEVAKLLCVLCGLLYPPSDKNKTLWLILADVVKKCCREDEMNETRFLQNKRRLNLG